MREEIDVHGVCRMFIHTDRLHRKAVEKAAGQFGIHRSQHFVLMNIARMGEGVTQKALAERLEISPAALAVTLGKLEKGGFVEKKPCERDGRLNLLALTERGTKIHRLSREQFARIDNRMFNGFSEDEMRQLCAFLTRMQNNLLADSEGAGGNEVEE